MLQAEPQLSRLHFRLLPDVQQTIWRGTCVVSLSALAVVASDGIDRSLLSPMAHKARRAVTGRGQGGCQLIRPDLVHYLGWIFAAGSSTE